MSDSQKTAVIFGLANKRSIAWAIAQKLHEAGWRLAITYQNERLEQEAEGSDHRPAGRRGFHVRCLDRTSEIAKSLRRTEIALRRAARHRAQRGVRAARRN